MAGDEVRLEVQGDDAVDVLNNLHDWLRQEPELRGLIRLIPGPIMPGTLGAGAGVLVIPVDAGRVPTVLAASLAAYLGQPRRSDTQILISSEPDGLSVRLDTTPINHIQELVGRLATGSGLQTIATSQPAGGSADQPTPGPASPAEAPDKVLVYLDTHDPEKTEAVRRALTELFASEDLDLDLTFGPVISSWLAHFKIRSKRVLTSAEVVSRIQKIEKAVEAVALDKPMAAVNLDHAEAASKLLTSLVGVDNAVVALGSLVMVKITTPEGRSSVYGKTLTVAELRAFEANQHLMSSPQGALEHLHLLATSGADSQPAPPPTEVDQAPATPQLHHPPTAAESN